MRTCVVSSCRTVTCLSTETQGNWAESHVRSLSPDELRMYSEILDCENPDLFKYLTGQETEPEKLGGNPVYQVRCWLVSRVSRTPAFALPIVIAA